MSRPMQIKHVGIQNVAAAGSTITTSLPNPSVFAPTFPKGNMEYYELYLRVYGNLNNVGAGSGTAVTDGPFKLVRSITLETDKHGKLMDGIDGLGMMILNQLRYRTKAINSLGSLAAAGTPTFESNFVLGLATKDALRPYDSILDMLKSQPQLTVQMGVYLDLVTTAPFATTNEIQNLNYALGVRLLPGPIVELGATDDEGKPRLPETPNFMPHTQVIKTNTTATQTAQTIDIPWGDRILRRLVITQRDITAGTTFAAMLNNTVLTTTAQVGININGFPWGDRAQWGQLQSANKMQMEVETWPNGVGVLDFDLTGRFGDMLSMLSRDTGTAQLIVDATGVASSQLWTYLESYKALPNDALRESQLNAKTA